MPNLLLRGNPIGQIKGVLFDKDGTLSNSENHLLNLAKLRIKQSIYFLKNDNAREDEISTVKNLLSSVYGLTPLGLTPSGCIAVASRNQNLIATATVFCLIGKQWPKSFEIASKIFTQVDFLEKELQPNMAERPLLPGVMDLLNEFKKSGILCALISNDTSFGIQNFLKKNNLESTFTEIWSADDRPSKPNPEAVESLCNIVGLHPSECALIGDADSDLQMARQAGIGIALGYISGWSNPPQLSAHQYLIHHWNELSIDQNP